MVTETLQEALAPTEKFQRLCQEADKRMEPMLQRQKKFQPRPFSLAERIQQRLPRTMEIKGNQGISLQDVRDGKASLEAFVAQLSERELAILVRGEGMCNPLVTQEQHLLLGERPQVFTVMEFL